MRVARLPLRLLNDACCCGDHQSICGPRPYAYAAWFQRAGNSDSQNPALVTHICEPAVDIDTKARR